jgi:hypothetical protein
MFTSVILGQPVEKNYVIPMKKVTIDNIYTPESRVNGLPVYPILQPADWLNWPVGDATELFGMPNPTKELRIQYQGY